MKTLFTLLLLVLCFLTSTLFAQLKLFGGLDLLYGGNAGCDEINSNFTVDSEFNYIDEGIYGSYGAGPAGGLNIGVNLCGDPVDGLLAFYYFRGNEIEYFGKQAGYGGNFNGTYSERVSGFMLEPKLRFRTNNEGKINFYASAGVLIPVGIKNVVKLDETSENSFSTITNHSVLEKKCAMSLGYSGGVGTTYNITSMIALFGELYYRGINLPWKTASFTEYNSTSDTPYSDPTTTTLDDLEVSQREIEYKKEITNEDNSDINAPRIELRDYDPLSSWGIKIGLQFMFESSGGNGAK